MLTNVRVRHFVYSSTRSVVRTMPQKNLAQHTHVSLGALWAQAHSRECCVPKYCHNAYLCSMLWRFGLDFRYHQ